MLIVKSKKRAVWKTTRLFLLFGLVITPAADNQDSNDDDDPSAARVVEIFVTEHGKKPPISNLTLSYSIEVFWFLIYPRVCPLP